MTSPSDLDQLLHRPTAAPTAAPPSAPPSASPAPVRPAVAVRDDHVLPEGTRLWDGRFVLRRVLGRGGFGITYEATDRRLERTVAIKELFPSPAFRRGLDVVAPAYAAELFAEARERFLREAAVLARFSHPGIVRIYEVGEENNTAYLVMELLDGRSLAVLQAARGGGALAEPDVLRVASCCGQALTVVHVDGVLHRDINPSNIVITIDGRAVLIDFGLAREFRSDMSGSMTRLVTPGYAPPEQYLGQGHFGPPTDVYGMSATLYKLLTGTAPIAALDRQGGAGMPSPRRLNPALSRVVSDGVMDGLELVADHRPATMVELLRRLGLRPALAESSSSVTAGADVPSVTQLRPVTPPLPLSAPVLAPPPPPPPLPLPPPPPPPAAPVPAGAVPAAAVPSTLRSKGRWKITVPLYGAAAALGSAAPVLVNGILAAIVLPATATAGDAVVVVHVRRHTAPRRWRERLPVPIYAAVRFVRNLLSMIWTAVPALIVIGALVAATLLLDGSGVSDTVQDWVLRAGGAGVALLLLDGVLNNRFRYRAAVIEDMARSRLVDASGRLTIAGWTLVGVALGLVVLAFALEPELWPLRR